jgi:hypothetical protein
VATETRFRLENRNVMSGMEAMGRHQP